MRGDTEMRLMRNKIGPWVKALFPVSCTCALLFVFGVLQEDRSSETSAPEQYLIVSPEKTMALQNSEAKVLEGVCSDLADRERFNSPYDILEGLVKNTGIRQLGSDRYRDLVETVAGAMEESPDCWEDVSFLIMTEGGLDYFTSVILLEALGLQEDTFRAHKILLALIQHPDVPMKMKRTAVSVLSLAEKIPVQTVLFLQQKASREPGLRDVALEVLGRLARRIPGFRDKIVLFLGETLEEDLREGNTERAADVLHALGRSGTDWKREKVRSLASHPCPRLRSMAVMTLGISAQDRDKVRILHTLRSDRDPSVRLAAIEALKRNQLEGEESQIVREIPAVVLEDLRWTAQNDPNRVVRLRTLEFFHESYQDIPSPVRETFTILSRTDPCKNVREWARWYLDHRFSS